MPTWLADDTQRALAAHAWLRWALACILAVLVASPPAWAQPEPYRLSYGDTVNVLIVGQPGLSVEAQALRPDGTISLPLVQEVRLEGRSIPEAQTLLKRAYQPYLANPQIIVNVARFRPQRVTVLGQVSRPGTYTFESPPTLVEALASAGGLSERASRSHIRIIVPGHGQLNHDLDQLLAGNEPSPRLREGTIVEVGEVWGPDLYRLMPLFAAMLTAGVLLAQTYSLY